MTGPDSGVLLALWRRDMLRLKAETARWVGVVVQPLMFWALLGLGLGDSFAAQTVPDMTYLQFLYPGIVVMVVLFTTVFATMSVIEDRAEGFLQQVLVGPGSRAAMVAGKIAGVTSVALIQAALCLLVAPAAGFDLAGASWSAFLLGAGLGCVGLAGVSFALAWLLPSTHAYHAIMAVGLLPLWLVSGAMYPPQGGWIDVLMLADPMAYMVDTMRHALHGGESPIALLSAGWSMLGVAAFAVGGFLLAVLTARRPLPWHPS